MKSTTLGEFEQLVLLGLLHAGADAYAVPVQREILRRTARDVTVAAVHTTLTRLEVKGLVVSRVGDPTPERGGRRKRHYAMTAAGRQSLRQSLSILSSMTKGLDIGWGAP